MRLWLIAILLLGGCGASDMYRGAIATESAKGADDFVDTARWGLCKAASIGSIRRAYGGSAEQARTYAEFCNLDEEGTAVLVGGTNDQETDSETTQ
jgi:hypothetical protein